MDAELSKLLDGRGGDGELGRVVAMLRRAMPDFLAFCEFEGVAPTNNAAERALRHVVTRRKTGGQPRGARRGPGGGPS